MVTITPLNLLRYRVAPCVSKGTPFTKEGNSHGAEGKIRNDQRSLPLRAGASGCYKPPSRSRARPGGPGGKFSRSS